MVAHRDLNLNRGFHGCKPSAELSHYTFLLGVIKQKQMPQTSDITGLWVDSPDENPGHCKELSSHCRSCFG